MADTSLSLYAMIAAIVAGIIAIVAIVLAVVLPGKEGPKGDQGDPGNPGESATSINKNYDAVRLPEGVNTFTLPSVYNYGNIVIPLTTGTGSVYFILDGNKVSVGDVFLVNNFLNSKYELFIQYKNFANNTNDSNEVSTNRQGNGTQNSFLVQIGTSATSGKKTLILMENAAP